MFPLLASPVDFGPMHLRDRIVGAVHEAAARISGQITHFGARSERRPIRSAATANDR
jgi:hypothetical protein